MPPGSIKEWTVFSHAAKVAAPSVRAQPQAFSSSEDR